MSENIIYTTTGKPHPYHIVRPSPWPMLVSFTAGIMLMGLVLMMHKTVLFGVKAGAMILGGGLALTILIAALWWKDVIFEAVTERIHTKTAEKGMKYGMAFFISSEVMFFFAFFWAFFHSAIFPNPEIGGIWPPESIKILPTFDLPFLMTMMLLLSGCCVTWAHHAILENDKKGAALGTLLGALIGFVFMGFQVYEYMHLPFHFKDTVYASTLCMATGFHGLHVVIGAIFLFVCWGRFQKGHFDKDHHFGFEAAAWYWHSVAVVWSF